jgi:hypothetical protein
MCSGTWPIGLVRGRLFIPNPNHVKGADEKREITQIIEFTWSFRHEYSWYWFWAMCLSCLVCILWRFVAFISGNSVQLVHQSVHFLLIYINFVSIAKYWNKLMFVSLPYFAKWNKKRQCEHQRTGFRANFRPPYQVNNANSQNALLHFFYSSQVTSYPIVLPW